MTQRCLTRLASATLGAGLGGLTSTRTGVIAGELMHIRTTLEPLMVDGLSAVCQLPETCTALPPFERQRTPKMTCMIMLRGVAGIVHESRLRP